MRLRNQLEKKKLQFEKDLGYYTNTEEKDEGKIFEYEEVKVDGEEVCDDLLHYIDLIKQQEKERKKASIRQKLNDQNSRKEREEYQCKKKLIWKNYILKR